VRRAVELAAPQHVHQQRLAAEHVQRQVAVVVAMGVEGAQLLFANARRHNQPELACAELKAWLSWARRSRLEPFKRLAATLRDHFDSVVRGMLDHRSNAFVEAMNGLMQQAKRAARGFRTAANFIAIAYLRLGKLTHLPASPFVPAMALSAGLTQHRMCGQVPHGTA
jgi:hypothetical protein